MDKNGSRVESRKYIKNNIEIEEIVIYEKGNLIAKYVIFNVDLVFINNISLGDEAYNTFESNYVEEFYYSLIGDERWNLYVVFVLEDTQYQEIEWSNKVFLERQNNYARKFIISHTEFTDLFIKNNENESQNNVTLKTDDPINEWVNILSNNGMLFCKDEYKSKMFESYIKGEKFSLLNKKTNKIDNQTKRVYSNLRISSIEFGSNYRQHCFLPSTKMAFSKVNLFVGPNGSGKTSILEAIELGITGQIYREQIGVNTKSIKKKSAIWDGKINFLNKLSITGVPNSKERKIRESIFYDNKERSIDKLNQAFHQYNYFSTEEVYQFCFTPDGQPDYENEFQKVIFGEEVKTIEKNISRYKSEFDLKIKNLNSSIEEHEQQLEIYSELISNNGTSVDFSTILRVLDKLYLKNQTRLIELMKNDPSQSKQIINLLNSLQDQLGIFDQYFLELNSMTSLGIYTFAEAKTKGKELEILLYQVNQELEFLREKYFILKTKEEELSKVVQEYKVNIEVKKSKLKIIEDKKEYIDNNFIFLSNMNKVYSRAENENKFKLISKRLTLLLQFHDNYNIDEMFSVPLDSMEDIEIRRIAHEQELMYLNMEYDNVKEKNIREKHKKENYMDQLKKLKVLGRTLIETNLDLNCCPLCGTEQSSYIELVNKIVAETEVDFLDIDLINKRNELLLIDKIQNKSIELEKIKEDMHLIQKVKSGIDYLIKNRLIEELNRDDLTVINFREIFNLVEKKIFSTKNEMVETQYIIEHLEREGYSYNSVITFKESFEQKIGDFYIHDNNLSILISHLNSQMTDLNESVIQDNVEVKTIEFELDLLNNEKFKVSEEGRKQRTLLEEYRTQIDVFKKWFVFKNVLAEHTTIIDILSINLSLWFSSLKELKYEINRLKEAINQQKYYDEVLEHKNEEIQKIYLDRESLKICKRARSVLNSLKPLKNFSLDFLIKNISEISEKFILLHSPREFNGLKLDINQRLVAIRENRNLREEIPIHLMSTGQRTAVALAVFFVMHKNMKNAPKFLLLDEPVANMDDLNVLSFLDFIRELSVNGIQLFITTANLNIAKLIRRKFSSLEEDFRYIKLSRTKGKIITGESYFFSPLSEEPIKVEAIEASL